MLKIAVVIPAKNEENSIGRTLQSIVAQTHKPVICIVVNDGSTDNTSQIIQEFSSQHSFIREYYIKGEKKYILGGHVIQVFNKGKEVIDNENIEYDYIVKLDADITFEQDILERISQKLELGGYGIVSGTPYYFENNKKYFEFSPLWHSHGQFKVYDRECLEKIGGIDLGLGWDNSDNIKAQHNHWKTAAFRDIFYQMHRKVGGKSSLKKGRINHGVGAYRIGQSFAYFLLRFAHDLLKPPFVTGAFFMLFGFFRSHFDGTERLLNKEQIQLLRKLYWQSFKQRYKEKEFFLFQDLNGKIK